MNLVLLLIPISFATSYKIGWIGYRLAFDRLLPTGKETMPTHALDEQSHIREGFTTFLASHWSGWRTIFHPIVDIM